MFWRTADEACTTSTLAIVDKPGVTLTEVLDDDYILQEVKSGNKRLLVFLTKPENLVALVTLCVTEPTDAGNDFKKYKYCHLASEVLSVDTKELTNALAYSNECLHILLSFLSSNCSQNSVNPLLANFSTRIFSVLVFKHPEQILAYMQAKPGFLSELISNLSVSCITDCLLYMATGNYQSEPITNIKMWLLEQNFLEQIISLFDEKQSEETHQNASYFLCELIRFLREVQYRSEDKRRDPILEKLQSPTVLNDLLDRICCKVGSCHIRSSIITNGCSVFITLLQTVYIPNNPLDAVNQLGKPQYIGQNALQQPAENANEAAKIWSPDPNHVVEKCLLDHLDDLSQLLISDDTVEPTSIGGVDTAFGAARLTLVKLFTLMLASGASEIHVEFARLDILRHFMELCLKYKSNNFLHTNLVNAILCVLYSKLPRDVIQLEKCSLIEPCSPMEPCSPAQPCSPVNVQNGDHKFENHVNGLDIAGLGSLKYVDWRFPSPLLKQLITSYHILRWLSTRCIEFSCQSDVIPPPFVGHLMRIAICIYFAQEEGPHRETMQTAIQGLPEDERAEWEKFVQDYLVTYIKKNEPDEPLSNSMETMIEKAEDFTKMTAALEQAAIALAEFNNRKIIEIPDEFGYAADAFTMDQDESVTDLMARIADINFQWTPIPQSAGELAFEEACTKRILLNDLNDEDFSGKNVEWIDEKSGLGSG